MASSNKDFYHNWKCYCQPFNDKTDEKTIRLTINDIPGDRTWLPIDLPHNNDVINLSGKWWYYKKFNYPFVNQQTNETIYLQFEPSNNYNKNTNIKVKIWLNNKQIFSSSLTSLNNPIELSSKLFHNEDQANNIIVICCQNSILSSQPCLLIYANGQITTNDEKSVENTKNSDILESIVVRDDNTDECIDVIFDRKRKLSQSSFKSLTHPSQPLDNNVLIPRLTIVILIVGTRGDVQPFIALGQELRRVGHRVRLATHEVFRSFVRSHGLEFYPLAGDPADLMAFMVKNAGIIPSITSIIEGDVGRKRRIVGDILLSAWQACTDKDDETDAPFLAEAIIANPPSFGHIHCAEKLQIPLHMMFTMPWSPTTEFSHPLVNIDSSIGPKDKLNLYSYDVIEMLTWGGMRDVINNFRKKTLGLDELHTRQAINALIDQCVPHTYCWSPSLVAKPKDWAEHIDVSGFFFLNLHTTFDNPPKDLVEFLGINQANLMLPPPIYIGFGSITGHDERRILSIVLDALTLTGYRALLSGFQIEIDPLPSNICRIGNIPHDWLFRYVSAVCHHGGAGTTAAGLRAGKPTIVVPFFGDQFFWGNIIEKSGAGPRPLPGKSLNVKQLIEAFDFVHKATTRMAAERIRDSILKENGCEAAVRAFHANLPLARLHSDFEPTFAACYRSDKYNIQISRPVAQVLVAAGVLEECELRPHVTRDWQFIHDNRIHMLRHKFIETKASLKHIASIRSLLRRKLAGVDPDVGHLTIDYLSLDNKLSDALDLANTFYDSYNDSEERQQAGVTNLTPGTKTAELAFYNSEQVDLTGNIIKPRLDHQRHDTLGAVAGSLIATVGIMSSITCLRGNTYASEENIVKPYRNEGRHISTKLFDTSLLTADDEQDISIAARRSGFHPKTCQLILTEFQKVKFEREQKLTASLKKTKTSTNDFLNN